MRPTTGRFCTTKGSILYIDFSNDQDNPRFVYRKRDILELQDSLHDVVEHIRDFGPITNSTIKAMLEFADDTSKVVDKKLDNDCLAFTSSELSIIDCGCQSNYQKIKQLDREADGVFIINYWGLLSDISNFLHLRPIKNKYPS